jgi:hypothetical protein
MGLGAVANEEMDWVRVRGLCNSVVGSHENSTQPLEFEEYLYLTFTAC